MHKATVKKRVRHLPPCGGFFQRNVFIAEQGVQFRQHIGLVQARIVLVRKFLIGQINGPLHHAGHIAARALLGGRTQKRQQVDQKRPVRGQRLAASQGRIKGIDGVFFRHAQTVVGCQMLFAFRQILFKQRYQAGAGRPHVDNGHPRQAGKPGLRHKGEVQGIEEDRLAAAHRSYAEVNP